MFRCPHGSESTKLFNIMGEITNPVSAQRWLSLSWDMNFLIFLQPSTISCSLTTSLLLLWAALVDIWLVGPQSCDPGPGPHQGLWGCLGYSGYFNPIHQKDIKVSKLMEKEKGCHSQSVSLNDTHIQPLLTKWLKSVIRSHHFQSTPSPVSV